MDELEKLLDNADENAKTNGNNIQYEISKIAYGLTIDEIELIANSIKNKRMIIQLGNYRLADRGERGTKGHLRRIQIMVAGQLDGLRIRKIIGQQSS